MSMKKIITCGLRAEYNFGCPSILHGIFELLQEVYGDDFELINLQIGSVLPLSVADMPYKTYEVKGYSAKRMLMGLYGIVNKDNDSFNTALNMIKQADVVIDLYGICFCDKLHAPQWRNLFSYLMIALQFPFSLYAKQHKIHSIKSTASYGRIGSKYNRKAADFAAKHVFDCMVAREVESQRAMRDANVSKKLLLSPDVANLMCYKEIVLGIKPVIGISTSHQIVRQWRSAEDYVSCIAALCLHINRTINAEVILIPNETNPADLYNDIDVSEDILEKLLSIGGHARILDVIKMTSSELKNHIASCEMVIASRYHSCVAALSASVPLMVIGWHYKYQELLHWYGQDKWLLSEEDCDLNKLIGMFDALWRTRAKRRAEIAAHYPQVREAVISTGKAMLGVQEGAENE